MAIALRNTSRIPRLAMGLIGLGLIAGSLFLGCRRNLQPNGISATPGAMASGANSTTPGASCPHHAAGGGCGMEGGSGCSHMGGNEAKDETQQVPIPARPQGSAALAWSLPDGWSEETGSGMRIATLRPALYPSVEVTIIALEGPAGGELANVNRWREQIGLPRVEASALSSTRKSVASKAGEVIVHELLGPNGTGVIAGIVSSPDSHTWFLKLAGDSQSLSAVRDNFLRWMRNLRFGN